MGPLFFMSNLLLFSKKECGPCILVKKYFNTMSDSRTESVKELLLDDGYEENLSIAKQYKINATPTLIVVNEDGEKVEEYIGGVDITKNITKLLDQYIN